MYIQLHVFRNTVLFFVAHILLGICMCPGMSLKAQQPFSPSVSSPLSENWRWRSLDNLSAKGVRSMTDDAHGDMWFGLNRGVIRYDGYTWTLFDDQHFLNSPVGVLKRTPLGSLYAGSESGLLQFTHDSWVKIFPQIDTVNSPVTCIAADSAGIVFAGVQNGLIQLLPGQTIIYTVLSRANAFRESNPDATIIILPDEILMQRNFGRVDDLFLDQDNQIWVFFSRNNDGKLLRFSPSDTLNGVLQKYTITESLGGLTLSNRNQIIKTSSGALWLINGFYKSGVLTKTSAGWQQLKLSDQFGGDELHTDILELSDGSLWIGGLGKLYIMNNDKWEVFAAPALPVPSSRVIFHESQNGQIWIAGVQGDVFHINYGKDRWVKYLGLNYHAQDTLGRKWYISEDGKVVYDDNDRWYSFDSRDGLIDAPVKLIITREGRIWVAGSHRGVAATAYLRGNEWIRQTHPALSWGIDSRSVFEDRDGSLWFGASVDRQEALGQISGILQLTNPNSDDLVWIHHTQRDGIVQHNVYGIGQSPDGRIWAGGTNLLNFENSRWSTLSGIDQLNEFVDIVHSKEKLWVGSRFYGLFSFDGNAWKYFTKNDGLPSNTIISIYEENPESVWVITDKDIAWFDGRKWEDGLFPETFRIPREGGEIMVASQGEIVINKALREWKRRAFPFSIKPSGLADDFWTISYVRGQMPPRTTITIYTETVDQAGNTFIAWEGNDYWEETPAHHLSYSWRLNNGQWSSFSSETSIVLTNLNSGNYHFEVRARDLDGNIEPIAAGVSFTVKPPIWKQAWFIILVISFLLIIGFYEIRLINRNRSLFNLNTSLSETNTILEVRQQKIERQKEQILQQKEELEKKTQILEEKTEKIVQQRDKLRRMVEKVEELSNVKQRFFTNISHEFRTPLTLILGSIEQLLKRQQENERSGLDQAYETIQRSSRRILRLINQILEIRKIETGKLQLLPTNGDIVSFTHEITALFNDMAFNQGIQLSFESSKDALPLMFDHDKIEKILFNLLSNAFKSTPSGGSITVSLTQKPESCQAHNQDSIDNPSEQCRVIFEIVDTGKGIPENELSHIFDRFYQVSDPSSQQKFAGSGIGLSYVKDLVKNHNGKIKVESEPGKRTSFAFEIPCVPGTWDDQSDQNGRDYNPALLISNDIRYEVESMNRLLDVSRTAESIEQVVPDNSGKLLVMIVEDEHELRNFIRNTLESDFDILEAVNGAMGYELALNYQPDLIITDVMMPQMNGIELCQNLKSNRATNHIPVIMLTARIAPENKLEGYLTGADAYIEKPFNMEFLRIRIENLIKAKEKTKDKVLRDLITQPGQVSIHSDDDKMLEKIRELLEENISNPDFDVESLSQEFALSRFHFSRKIKQITGLTPKEIINSFRLKRAGQILIQNKMTISEIAYMVGFDHPNSFSRAFRKYYNMTPSEFASQN